MTKEEFKKIIPKASANQLKELGFGYILPIKRSFRPIWMQIPSELQDCVPIGFKVIDSSAEIVLFNEKHKVSNPQKGKFLKVGLYKKDTLS